MKDAKDTVVLGIARHSAGNTFSAPGKTISISPDLRQTILDRDNHICRYCGFEARKYQDIHILNGDQLDLRPDNLTTVCIFCHQCFNLDKAAEMRSAILVWMPEISQIRLHHIARAAYVARISQGPVADAARRCLDLIMQRREDARKRLGTDDPFILANVLGDYITDKTYEKRQPKLEGIRLFPLDRRVIKEADLEFNQFPQILAYWRSKDGPFGKMVPREWLGIYKTIKSAA